MDLNLIKVFLAVYRHKSITLASHELDLTQPAVSASLKRLKRHVQKELFIRKGHGVEPTSTAIMLARQFDTALEIIESATRDVNQFTVFCTEPLLFLLSELDAKILESPSDEEKIIKQLRGQQVDLVVDTLFTQDPAYVIEPLMEEPVVLLCRKDHPRIRGSLSLEQVYTEQHIDLQMRRQNKAIGELLATEPVLKRDIRTEVSSVSCMMLMAACSDSLCGVTRSMANRWAGILDLQILPSPVPLKSIKYQMIYLRRDEQNARHKALRNQVSQLFAAHF